MRNMKKHLVTMVLALILLGALLLSCTGCFRSTPQEERLRFSLLSQEEKRSYITDYLQQTYGLTCTIDQDVHQKQDGPFLLEDQFFAVATTEERELITLWVTKDGKITDSVFLLQMAEELTDYFTAEVQELVPDCKVNTHTNMVKIPTDTLTDAGEIRDFLTEQPTETFLRIYVDSDADVGEALVEELIRTFSYCTIHISVYVCDDLDAVDVKNYSGDPQYRGYHWKEDI